MLFGARTWEAILRMCCSTGTPSCCHAAPPGPACGGRYTPLQACTPGLRYGNLLLSTVIVRAWLLCKQCETLETHMLLYQCQT